MTETSCNDVSCVPSADRNVDCISTTRFIPWNICLEKEEDEPALPSSSHCVLQCNSVVGEEGGGKKNGDCWMQFVRSAPATSDDSAPNSLYFNNCSLLVVLFFFLNFYSFCQTPSIWDHLYIIHCLTNVRLLAPQHIILPVSFLSLWKERNSKESSQRKRRNVQLFVYLSVSAAVLLLLTLCFCIGTVELNHWVPEMITTSWFLLTRIQGTAGAENKWSLSLKPETE